MTSLKIVLLGFLRHTIGLLGLWLVQRGYIGEDARASFVMKATEEAFGACMIFGAYVWSAIDKKMVIDWIRKALHMAPPTKGGSEHAAARRISRLVTSPGTTAVPPIVAILVCLSVIAPLTTSCSSLGAVSGGGLSLSASTVYKDPALARTMLTALETLRYHAAEVVARAYVTGRITKAQSDAYAKLDDDFRANWAKASELVQLWLVSKAAPPQVQQAMDAVTRSAAALDAESTKVQ